MQDAHALVVAFLAHLDELVAGALKPGGLHHAVIVPDLAEVVPQPRVAQDGPILDQVADGQTVKDFGGHVALSSYNGA
jgi:hypothetical protein